MAASFFTLSGEDICDIRKRSGGKAPKEAMAALLLSSTARLKMAATAISEVFRRLIRYGPAPERMMRALLGG